MPHPYTVALDEARPAFLAELEAFLATASALDDHALLGASRAHGWSGVDCLVHVRMGLQELLAGIPAAASTAPTVDAASYWTAFEATAADDPVPGILVTRRTAAAYTRPGHAVEHLREVIAGLTRVVTTMPDTPVGFQGHVLTAGDLLATWAVEVVLHHHDLDVPGAPLTPAALQLARRTAEALGADAAASDDDLAVALNGFGRG